MTQADKQEDAPTRGEHASRTPVKLRLGMARRKHEAQARVAVRGATLAL